MKILLISPASGNWKGIGKHKLFNGKTFRFSMLSLLSVAAITPNNYKVKIIDEQTELIPENEDFDLVGITVMTATAPRVYELCKYFHERKIPVVLGGFHPTLIPEEAEMYADSVVVGPAYGAWQSLLKDFEAGKLKKRYTGSAEAGIPDKLPRHLLNKANYITGNATFATIGCTNLCHFCSISAFHGGRRYQRSVNSVVEEIRSFKEKFFMLVDDNLTQNREYVIELLKVLSPLKKKWFTQASIEIYKDEELLGYMKEAGCVGLFIGLETFSVSALGNQEKNINTPLKYKEAIDKIHQYGIFIESGIIFGFDTDNITVFRETLRTIEELKVDAVQVSILTPLPGTQLYSDMQNRIIDRNWAYYDYKYAVFNPKNMSREELQAGSQWVRRSFYKPRNVIKRFFRWLFMPDGWKNLIYPLILNIAYSGRSKRLKIRGYDPALKRVENCRNISYKPELRKVS